MGTIQIYGVLSDNITRKNLKMRVPFKHNFREKGYKLKIIQANYYSFLGFTFFIVSAFFLYQGMSNLFVAAFWLAGFIPAYLMDEYFNRQRQIKKLQRIFGPLHVDEKGQEQDA